MPTSPTTQAIVAPRAFCQQSLALFRSVNGTRGVVRVLRRLGTVIWPEGEAAAARPLYEQSLALARGVADPHSVALCLHALSEVAVAEGE